MRHDDAVGLGEALRRYLSRKGLGKQLDRASAIADWPAIVGTQIAKIAEPEGVSETGILFVRVQSAAWMQELQLMEPQILTKLRRQGKKIERILWRVG